MHVNSAPTRTDGTIRNYVRRYRMLKRQFENELAVSDITPDELTGILIGRKENYSASTFRQYKASVLYVLRTQYPAHELAIEALEDESSAGLQVRSKKTSGRKQKRVATDDFSVLAETLRTRATNGYRYAQGLLFVLKATLLTGLRPIEWAHSETAVHNETGREILRVRNAKNTNNRANGELREMFIDGLSEEEKEAVQGAIDFCSGQTEEQVVRIQKAMRNEFEKVRALALGRRSLITLYSFRHQFLADSKATFVDPVAITALAGHSSTKTVFEHYGKRRHGTDGVKVLPTSESVEAVILASDEIGTLPVKTNLLY